MAASKGQQAKSIGDQLRKHVATMVAATVLEIDANLRESTPIDTGHARANWVPSVAQPAAVEAAGTSDGAHEAGVAAVLGYKLENGPAFVSNNVPYIVALNAGSSTQAPSLFIEAAVDKATATIRQRYVDRAVNVELPTAIVVPKR